MSPLLESIARWVMLTGLVLLLVGGLMWLISRIPGLNNLPGTIKIEGQGVTFIFPLLACIVISIVLTVVLNLALRLFK
jgi:hypothetical protein